MSAYEIITILSVLSSPLIAVQVTKLLDKVKEDKNRKMEIFKILMGQRGMYPRSNEFIIALNQIDIVYYNNTKVLEKWKKFYEVTLPNHPELSDNGKYLNEMLFQMAKVLKYNNLDSIDIGRYYSTQQREDDLVFQRQYYSEYYRVLKNSEHFGAKREE
ncbi:DUF6680 family protein [Flavobacterium sp. 3-210]